MYRACIVVCTGKRGGRHYAVKQGKGPQKGSGSESEEVTDEDDPVGEAEMRSEEDTDEDGPVGEEGEEEEEEEGAKAAGESLEASDKARATEEFANSLGGDFRFSGNTGNTLTLGLQKLMGRSSLRYFNSRTEVGKLLAHSGGPESPWGVGPALVTKDNLAARLHAFEP